MIAIGMLLCWAGYTTGLYGYCLTKGYDITFGDLGSPFRGFTWPARPPLIPDTQITPGSTSATPATTTAAGGGSGLNPGGGITGTPA